MSTLSTHIRKSNVKPHPNLRSKMPAGTENIVAFSRLKGPRVPKLPQLGLVLRGTVGRSFWPHFHSHAILNNSHRLWLSVLFERQFRNQSFFFASCFGFVLAQKKPSMKGMINIHQYTVSPEFQTNPNSTVPLRLLRAWSPPLLSGVHLWSWTKMAGALPCCRGCRGCELQEGFKP